MASAVSLSACMGLGRRRTGCKKEEFGDGARKSACAHMAKVLAVVATSLYTVLLTNYLLTNNLRLAVQTWCPFMSLLNMQYMKHSTSDHSNETHSKEMRVINRQTKHYTEKSKTSTMEELRSPRKLDFQTKNLAQAWKQ